MPRSVRLRLCPCLTIKCAGIAHRSVWCLCNVWADALHGAGTRTHEPDQLADHTELVRQSFQKYRRHRHHRCSPDKSCPPIVLSFCMARRMPPGTQESAWAYRFYSLSHSASPLLASLLTPRLASKFGWRWVVYACERCAAGSPALPQILSLILPRVMALTRRCSLWGLHRPMAAGYGGHPDSASQEGVAAVGGGAEAGIVTAGGDGGSDGCEAVAAAFRLAYHENQASAGSFCLPPRRGLRGVYPPSAGADHVYGAVRLHASADGLLPCDRQLLPRARRCALSCP
eukprot:SAG11_NODE_182_length_13233_cov_59.525238_4_plen_286_part_00